MAGPDAPRAAHRDETLSTGRASRPRRRLHAVVAGAVVAALAFPATLATAAGPGHTVIPNAVPSAATPAVNDGQVNALTQVGSTMVAGGTFSSVTPPGGSAQSRSAVVSFDAATGALRAGFHPTLNGTVQDVLPGPTASSVYIAGSFTTVNGVAQSHVALLDVTTGALVPGFKAAATNGVVNALTMARGRLILGGNFTMAGGVAHGGLASISPTTGALDGLMGVDVADRHNDTGSGAQGAVGVRDLEATSGGDKLAVIGNFKRVDGLSRDQLVVLDATSSAISVDPDWRTRRYEPYCFNWAFDTYVRGVAISPDDNYFVVTATGGHNTGTLCDTAARFEFSSAGDDIQPTWVDYTGGDTLWSVEVTENAVYVGGHQRWMNNSDASDSNGQGSLPRPGLAVLDPLSGLPLAWNPGRNPRGAAAFALYASTSGVWVGSDTEWIGNYRYKRPRLAYFPLSGGAPPASDQTPGLPGDVWLGGGRSVDQGNVLYRVNAGGPTLDGIDGGPAWTADDTSSPYRNDGSNAAGWGPGATADGTVPASTPSGVFDSERWSPSDNPRMSWDFPAAAGLPLQVRLYFANRCGCTSSAGSRAFDVDLDGQQVLNDYDIVASVGDQVGTMRSFNITSDGNVDIDFSHVVENPLINAIEIVRRDLPAPVPATNSLKRVTFDGTNAGTPSTIDPRGIDWNNVRSAFMVGDKLVYGMTDGYLYWRTLTPTTTGPASRIDPYNDPVWSDVTTGSGNTFRGRVPNFYGELSGVSGAFYARDRIYYTRTGDSQLYWRWFNADSGVVGSQLFTASGGRDWSDTGGMFVDGSSLYVVSRSTGKLSRMSFTDGVPQGSPVQVDGGVDWRARAVFIGPSVPANQPPNASFTSSCSGLVCSVDSSASGDPDGTIASRSWDFGDGGTASGTTASHSYGSAGTYTVTLTVTDNVGASTSTSKSVTVSGASTSAVTFVGSATASANTTAPAVTVPAGVQAGDVLVLVGSYGASGTSPATPAGWTLVGQRDNVAMESRAWTRVATAADAGASVGTTLGTVAKSSLVVAAYRGASGSDPVAAIASSVDASTAQHTSPTVSVPAGGWALQLWSDKSSGTTAWSAPAGVSVRDTVIGSGTGRVSALLADSGGALPAGAAGGQTATTDSTSGRGIAWTLALRPGA